LTEALLIHKKIPIVHALMAASLFAASVPLIVLLFNEIQPVSVLLLLSVRDRISDYDMNLVLEVFFVEELVSAQGHI
jgi:hypothetical protein